MGTDRPAARCRRAGHRVRPGHRRRRPGRARHGGRGRRRAGSRRTRGAADRRRADELLALRERGALEQAEPREGDEAVRDELTRRAGWHVQADIDAWLARALATHRGHYADPAARETAAGLLPQPVLAHAALLSALTRLVPAAAPGELAVAARLATADPEATAGLATLLTRATEPADPAGSPG